MGLDQIMHQNPDHTAVAGAFEVGTITIPHFVHVVQAYRERREGGYFLTILYMDSISKCLGRIISSAFTVSADKLFDTCKHVEPTLLIDHVI